VRVRSRVRQRLRGRDQRGDALGANDFHGRAFAYIRDDGLDACARPYPIKAKTLRAAPRGYLSGPIKREKAFFFVGFEYLKSDREAIVTSPRGLLRRRGGIPGPGIASRPQATTANSTWPSWTGIPARRTCQLAVTTERTQATFNSGVGESRRWSTGARARSTIGDRGRLDPHLNGNTTNELRGVFNRAHPQGNVNAGQTYEILRPSGQLGAPVNYGLIGEDWIQFVDNVSLVRGAHTAKFGVSSAMSATSATSELQGRPVLLHHGSALQPVRPEHASLAVVHRGRGHDLGRSAPICSARSHKTAGASGREWY